METAQPDMAIEKEPKIPHLDPQVAKRETQAGPGLSI